MRKIIAAALVLTLLGAGGAEARQADGGGKNKGRDHFEQSGRGSDRGRGRGGDRGRVERRDDPGGAWSRGQRLPGAYQGQQGLDYRSHRLRRPPAGYRWVRVGDDYVLTATATGLILEVIPGF